MPKVRAKHRFEGVLEEKYCLKCDKWKLLKEFHKHKQKWDGLHSRCKVCHSIAYENRRRKIGIKPRRLAEHRFEGALEEKHCLTCDEWKVLKEFSKDKRAWDGLQSSCKGCTKIAQEKRRRELGIKPKALPKHRFQGDLEEKQCSKCDEWKVLKEFNKDKTRWDCLESRCKGCKAIAHKNQMSTEHGRERIRAQGRKANRKRTAQDVIMSNTIS